ncbi:MAG: MotA/TolQ/ExbB proton channel family protein [Flavobacteriales bacterium]|nr:MotA/TolQ/ExbB proton channel family protein [Flavobacteriales bacterium]
MFFESLQVAADQVADSGIETEVVPVDKTLSIMDLIMSGGMGGHLIMISLFILSVIAMYIFVERYSAIRKATKLDVNFMNNISDQVHEGKLDAAKVMCQQAGTPVARMIEKGISRIGKPLEDINTAIENTGKLEVFKLETNVSTLATISGAAPMIGFLGTVIGMIVAFHDMASAGGQIDVELLSKGIYTAMTTTVAGLVVGIFAFIGYNLLVVRVDKVVHQMEASTTEFMDLLNEPI